VVAGETLTQYHVHHAPAVQMMRRKQFARIEKQPQSRVGWRNQAKQILAVLSAPNLSHRESANKLSVVYEKRCPVMRNQNAVRHGSNRSISTARGHL
jgi:hypothetical protein